MEREMKSLMSVESVRRDQGATMVEYALVVVVVPLLAVLTVRLFGTVVSDLYSTFRVSA